MKHDRKRKLVQTCTICGNTGHNRRRCTVFPTLNDTSVAVDLVLMTDQTTPNTGITSSTSKTSRKIKTSSQSHSTSRHTPSVMVETVSPVVASPHIVNLKNDEHAQVVKETKAYVEPEHAPVKQMTHDWSEMIRASKRATLSHTLNQTVSVGQSLEQSSTKTAITPLVPPIRTRRQKKNPIKRFVRTLQAVMMEQVEEWRERVEEIAQEQVARITRRFQVRSFVSVGLVVVMLVAVPFPAVGYYQRLKTSNGKIVSESTDAFRALQSSTVAAFSADLVTAQSELTAALAAFSEVNTYIAQDHRLLLSLAKLLPIIGPEVKSREQLLVAGQHVALANAYLLKGVSQSVIESGVPTDVIGTMSDHVNAALPQYQQALSALLSIEASALPAEYREAFGEFRLLFAAFVDDLSDLVDLSRSLALVFGSEEFHRYLVVFQNPHELRPSGGFVGSLAVIDVQKGKIQKIDVPGGGPYDLSGQLGTYIKPPLPLQLLNSRWELQDANWFANFPTTAEKLAWFYRESAGSTVDGVIAINAPVLERFLQVLGPVTVEGDQLTLTSDNALTTLQYEVEKGYDKEKNQPKAVIGDLIGLLQERLESLSPADMLRLLAVVHTSLEQKDIQISVTDPRVSEELSSFGWTGEVKSIANNQDYLMLVNANIRSQKSDAKITQSIEHQAMIDADGSIIDTVIIKRTHSGVPGEEFYGGPNVSYARLYVPEGAELIDAGGFTYPPEDAFRVPEQWYEEDSTVAGIEKTESIHAKTGTVITHEFGKTAFGNWITTNPGETSEAFFVYKLPFRLTPKEGQKGHGWRQWLPKNTANTLQYSLLTQKQSGSESVFHSSVILPTGFTPMYASIPEMTLANNGAEISLPLEGDVIFGLVAQTSSGE